MTNIEWNDKYLTGIELIDNQHKKILESMNLLDEACEKMSPKEIILKLFDEFDKYTDGHFNTEEKYMKEFKYPDYELHKSEHQNFKKKYMDIRENYYYEKAGPVYVMAIHVNSITNDWLENHIGHFDRKLAEFLRNRI